MYQKFTKPITEAEKCNIFFFIFFKEYIGLGDILEQNNVYF